MSNSLYRLYDDDYMEVARILTLEEIMCVVHDVIMSLEADRIRDMGPSRLAYEEGRMTPCTSCGEEKGIRPGWKSLEAVKHAMDTAGVSTKGIQTRQDRVDVFGEEAAKVYDEAQLYMDKHLSAVADIMEEAGVNMQHAIHLYQVRRITEDMTASDLEIPDDLGGFGWSA